MVEQNFASFNQKERLSWITATILEQGAVQVDELAERFSVSRMTIHRDLDELETQGVLRKVRNGATAQPSTLFESDVRYRGARQQAEKERLAEAAFAYVEPGQAIFLDEATTLLPLARRLAEVEALTIITNFLPILNELSGRRNLHLIALGGQYLPAFDSFTGLLCEETLQRLHADLFFTSTTAVRCGLAFHPNEQIARVKRVMMDRSAQQFLLLDHTKFGKSALHQVAPLGAFTRLIVDDGVSSEDLAGLREAGLVVEILNGRVEASKG